jgi:small subunit ribosomal protein S20
LANAPKKTGKKHAGIKAMRQSARRQARNRRIRMTARTEVKDAKQAIAAGNKDQAQQALKQAIRALDKAAAKGVIKKNNAARRKARLMKKFNQLQTA